MRGVHQGMELEDVAEERSSPHARGPPVGQERTRWETGIIPACAGSTRRHKND